MHVAVTGSHGLIASALIPTLERSGHQVRRVERDGEKLDLSGIAEVDAVVHLAGAGIGDAKWTPERKRLLVDSRVGPTSQLAQALADVPAADRPRVLVSASAVGVYGDRGDEQLTEDAAPGTGFLADLVKQWESATLVAEQAGVRVVNVRTGIVLTPTGGALKPLLTPFKLGLGGPIGSGDQWWSWITLDDEVAGIVHVLGDESVSGPVNFGAPNPVTYGAFAKTLGRVLNRPAVLPTPKFAPALKLGREAVDEMLLAGQRMVPAKLLASGFAFGDPELEPALRRLLREK